MKARYQVVAIATLAIAVASCQTTNRQKASALAANDSPSMMPVIETTVSGLEAPEGAVFDPKRGVVYVSNIVGEGDAKDGNGWIARLDLKDPQPIAERWITSGLNAPKGMRIAKDKLWVADIDTVHRFDIATGTREASIPIAGAKFLNDIAIVPDGDGVIALVSDTLASRIHQIKGDKPQILATENLEAPNGLLYVDRGLLIAAWGYPEADWSTDVAGRFLRLDLEFDPKSGFLQAGAPHPQSAGPIGNLDGVEIFRGRYLVSDWVQGTVRWVDADGQGPTLYAGTKGAADIAVDPVRARLFIPKMLDNELVIVDLSGL